MSKSSKLADKKINTLIEKRIQEIARKEDEKQLDKRVFREVNTSFLNSMGTYTASTNRCPVWMSMNVALVTSLT